MERHTPAPSNSNWSRRRVMWSAPRLSCRRWTDRETKKPGSRFSDPHDHASGLLESGWASGSRQVGTLERRRIHGVAGRAAVFELRPVKCSRPHPAGVRSAWVFRSAASSRAPCRSSSSSVRRLRGVTPLWRVIRSAWHSRAVHLLGAQPNGRPTSRWSRRPTRITNIGLAVARRPRLSATVGRLYH